MNTLILIDGDNIEESCASKIQKEAERFVNEGEFSEIHCFCDFPRRKQSWQEAYLCYGATLHMIPGTKRQGESDPNTSDISLVLFAQKKLYESPDLQTVIVVANDKDYVALAKTIREDFHKTAVMFYTEPKDSAVDSFSDAVFIGDDNKVAEALTCCIENLFEKYPKRIFLNILDVALRKRGIYCNGKPIEEFLADMFRRFPALSDRYELKKGRIIRTVN